MEQEQFKEFENINLNEIVWATCTTLQVESVELDNNETRWNGDRAGLIVIVSVVSRIVW